MAVSVAMSEFVRHALASFVSRKVSHVVRAKVGLAIYYPLGLVGLADRHRG